MPQSLIRNINKHNAVLVLWTITESLSEMYALAKASAIDISETDKFKLDSRKKQFIASRLLVNKLGFDVTKLKYTSNGKPYFSDSKSGISFSHSGDYVACIVADVEVGVDIQVYNPKLENIRTRFLCEVENKEISSLEKLHAYWCAKEALFKLYAKGNVEFKTELLIQPFNLSNKGSFSGKILKEKSIDVELFYEKTQEYMLVYCTE
jgi:4'-phosphopantetheinyl transferase